MLYSENINILILALGCDNPMKLYIFLIYTI
jgi:hypothetical protein